MTDFVTVNEFCRRHCIARSTFYEAVKRGTITVFRPPGIRRTLVPAGLWGTTDLAHALAHASRLDGAGQRRTRANRKRR